MGLTFRTTHSDEPFLIPMRPLFVLAVFLASQFLINSLNAQTAPNTLPPPASSSTYTLTARFKDYPRKTFGPEALLFSAMSAGIGQARNAPSAWEQGMAGFGRRYASSMAQRAVSNVIQLPIEAVLGEDSRYVLSQRHGIWPRVGDAIVRSFVIRTSNGTRAPPVGVLAGAFGGGLVSRTWNPDGHDRISQGIVSGVYSIGFYVGTNVFHEFWPDIRKHLHF